MTDSRKRGLRANNGNPSRLSACLWQAATLFGKRRSKRNKSRRIASATALESLESRLLLSATPVFKEYPVPTANAGPADITKGPDGNLWFTEANSSAIGRFSPTSPTSITEFATPTVGSTPGGITTGPDGNLWFTETNGNNIGRITPSGKITEFAVPTLESEPDIITPGPNGNLWFTETGGNQIGEITPTGAITEFPIPTANGAPGGIVVGPNGNLWFTEINGNKIGEITTSGTVTEFTIPTADSSPSDITVGPDGNLWFTEGSANQIGRITTAGVITEFAISTAESAPVIIAPGPDGNLWFTELQGNNIGEITTAGTITEFAVPTSDSGPLGIVTGPDDNLWYTEGFANQIGRIQLGVPPVVTAPTSESLNENTSFTFASPDAISIADPSGTSEQLTLSVGEGTLDLATTTGLTVTGNGTSSLTATGSLDDLNADLPSLVYTPTSGYTGGDSLDVTDKDPTIGLPETVSLPITVNVVAAPPSITAPDSITLNENTTFDFVSPNAISVGDTSGTAEQLTLTVDQGVLTFGTTTGLTITGNGSSSLTAVGSLASLTSDLPTLTYAPTTGYTTSDSVDITDEDTTDSLSATGSVTITVNPVNAPPAVTAPGLISLNANATFSFTGPNAISVTDASGTAEQLTLTVGQGTLTLSTTTGLTVTGNGSSSLTATGSLASLTSDMASLTYTPAANFGGGDTLSLSDTDTSDNLTGTASTAITVDPVAGPTATFSNNGPIVEGSTAVVRFTDPQDSLVTGKPGYRYSYDFGDNGTFEIVNSKRPTATVPLSYLMSPGPHVVQGRITDKEGQSTDYTTTIVVKATTPTVTLKTPQTTAVAGQPVPIAINVGDDVASARRGEYTLTISFGDGTSRTLTTRRSVVLTHVYTTDGSYDVSVTATDRFGNPSEAATQSIGVVPVALESDPFGHLRTTLFVGGTPGDDTIDITSAGRGTVSINLNGTDEGDFTTYGPIVVFGQGGHDVIDRSPGVRNPALLVPNSNGRYPQAAFLNGSLRWAGFQAALEILNR